MKRIDYSGRKKNEKLSTSVALHDWHIVDTPHLRFNELLVEVELKLYKVVGLIRKWHLIGSDFVVSDRILFFGDLCN